MAFASRTINAYYDHYQRSYQSHTAHQSVAHHHYAINTFLPLFRIAVRHLIGKPHAQAWCIWHADHRTFPHQRLHE